MNIFEMDKQFSQIIKIISAANHDKVSMLLMHTFQNNVIPTEMKILLDDYLNNPVDLTAIKLVKNYPDLIMVFEMSSNSMIDNTIRNMISQNENHYDNELSKDELDDIMNTPPMTEDERLKFLAEEFDD